MDIVGRLSRFLKSGLPHRAEIAMKVNSETVYCPWCNQPDIEQRLERLAAAARLACAAVERGEPFVYLDNVVVPTLRTALEENVPPVKTYSGGRAHYIKGCDCPDTTACLRHGVCLYERKKP